MVYYKDATLQHFVKHVQEFNLYDQGQINKSWKNIEPQWEGDHNNNAKHLDMIKRVGSIIDKSQTI